MKFKKLLALIVSAIAIVTCTCFVGCFSAEKEVANVFGERFDVVEELSDYTFIIYDKETGVEYLYCSNPHNTVITVLLDKDGKPLIYRGY